MTVATESVGGTAGGRQAGEAGPPRHLRVTVDWRYSRFVGLMRWLLPISAVALVAVLFVWPYLNDREDGMPLVAADWDIGDGGRLVMTNARFLGSDDDGQPYLLTAEEAWQNPDRTDVVNLERLQGDITLNSGEWLSVSADQGVYLQEDEKLSLAGNVSMFSDQGFELHTESAEIDLAAGTAHGAQPVSGQGPPGSLDATAFRVTERGDRLRFDGPVRMTLYPDSMEQ